MTTKHTPGQWIGYENTGVYIGDGYDNPVFETGCGCCTGSKLTLADANLIASAPDLLEALIPIAERGEISAEIITNARVAIAKATGEQYEN
jgi:hypothetical protein